MNYLGQRLESHICFALFGAVCYGCFFVFRLLPVLLFRKSLCCSRLAGFGGCCEVVVYLLL